MQHTNIHNQCNIGNYETDHDVLETPFLSLIPHHAVMKDTAVSEHCNAHWDSSVDIENSQIVCEYDEANCFVSDNGPNRVNININVIDMNLRFHRTLDAVKEWEYGQLH